MRRKNLYDKILRNEIHFLFTHNLYDSTTVKDIIKSFELSFRMHHSNCRHILIYNHFTKELVQNLRLNDLTIKSNLVITQVNFMDTGNSSILELVVRYDCEPNDRRQDKTTLNPSLAFGQYMVSRESDQSPIIRGELRATRYTAHTIQTPPRPAQYN